MAKLKTPSYNRKAVDKYIASKDKASILLPLGTKDKIKALSGESVNAFINRLVLAEIERLEKGENHGC